MKCVREDVQAVKCSQTSGKHTPVPREMREMNVALGVPGKRNWN